MIFLGELVVDTSLLVFVVALLPITAPVLCCAGLPTAADQVIGVGNNLRALVIAPVTCVRRSPIFLRPVN